MTRGNLSTGLMSPLWRWRGAPVWACRVKDVVVPVGNLLMRISPREGGGGGAVQWVPYCPGYIRFLRIEEEGELNF